MCTIEEMYERINKIDLENAIPKLIEQTSYEITSLNKQQLYAGFSSFGEKIAPDYKSKEYASKKNILNSAPGYGTPDVFLTGAFYKGFGVVVSDKTFTSDSVDSKAPRLELLYGSSLYGLDKANSADYAQNTLLPAIRAYIKEVSGI